VVFFFAGVWACTMDINCLPPEVLTKIFSYLPQLDLLTTINTVCHYWNEVAFSSSLWKTIDIDDSNNQDRLIYLQNIAQYRDFVQNLFIYPDQLIKFFDIRKCRYFSNLRNLQIKNYLHNEYSFKNIVDLCPGIVAIECSILKSVDLSILSNLQLRNFDIHINNISKGENKIALNKIMYEFIPNQCSLQSLSIRCPVSESETIIKLLRNLKDLTCLDLSGSKGVDGCMFTDLPELSKLTALNLSSTTVSDEGLKNIATKASHLKTLTLNYCTKLSDIGIGYIADGCHCLKRLEINKSNKSNDVRLFPSTLESLGKGCQKLKHFSVENCTGVDDSGVIALVQNCHDLEYLNLSSKNISSSSLHAILHFCSNLFYLELRGYKYNAASVESLLTKHRFINYVDIGSCSNINAIDLCKSTETNSGILETHSHARRLVIRTQTPTGYFAVEQIVTFCPDLRFLVLYPINTAVRDDIVEIAFGKCRYLETLLLDTNDIINRKDFKTNLK